MKSFDETKQVEDGWVRVATATPKLQVADVDYNCAQIIQMILEAEDYGAEMIVLPELAVTGYTCGDLFQQMILLEAATQGILRITRECSNRKILAVIGFPFLYSGKIYNAAAYVYQGRVLGIVPKRNLPNYAEYYEYRWFTPGRAQVEMITLTEKETGEKYEVPFGMNLLLRNECYPAFCVAAELCEDVWVCDTPATQHALAGATVIANCSASDETVGKADYRRNLIRMTSARLVCAYVYANAGAEESTQDMVFGGQSLICENGAILKESALYEHEIQFADIDLEHIVHERLRMNTFRDQPTSGDSYYVVNYVLSRQQKQVVERIIDPHPFVPNGLREHRKRCEEIFHIQARGLAKRLQHIHCSNVVIGISGGLDSTLALLVAVQDFDILQIPHKNIHAITMPAFGTTDRTYGNAVALSELIGTSLRKIEIRKSVLQHFEDIGHDVSDHNVVYENSQARERTQVLMDIANQVCGIVIGTGDMSELALGWATYNGDHMSMYAVNSGVPKTLVRYLIEDCAEREENVKLQRVLRDILDTPVSPELLPAKEGEITQITEDLVGPYELHDFFLYQIIRYGDRPAKVYASAKQAFKGNYEDKIILKWMKVFYRRFFAQQYKRSCLPDGPKVGSVAVSPRGDLRMPSDACVDLWKNELGTLE